LRTGFVQQGPFVSDGFDHASHSRPHVVVVGNHKGGTGKSTVAMHVIVALLKEGRRVASFDLDSRQRTLTRYVENRQDWAVEQNFPLELPDHCAVERANSDSVAINAEAEAEWFTSSLAKVQRDFDFIVIDTPSGEDHLSLLAHGLADTLVTPINDSFIDLDVIVTFDLAGRGPPQPSLYSDAVTVATDGRHRVCDRPTDWVIVRNRLSPLASRNQRQVADILGLAATKIGFRSAPGLSERVVFREFFPVGLTAFDPLDELLLGVKPTVSHVMARAEIRELVQAIGLVPSQGPAEQAHRVETAVPGE
jgi:chromosome partitioning protein